MLTIARPTSDEYAPFYSTYIDLVKEGDVLERLAAQYDALGAMLAPLDDEVAARSYEPGKWSLKEVLGHMIDMERLFSFRALAFARQPGVELPGCEQDEWAQEAGFQHRALSDLLAELAAVRRASLTLFASFDETHLTRTGLIEGNRLSVRAIVYIVAGHDLHHQGVLAQRYLKV